MFVVPTQHVKQVVKYFSCLWVIASQLNILTMLGSVQTNNSTSPMVSNVVHVCNTFNKIASKCVYACLVKRIFSIHFGGCTSRDSLSLLVHERSYFSVMCMCRSTAVNNFFPIM